SMFLVVVAAFAHIASSNDAAAEKPQRNRHFIALPRGNLISQSRRTRADPGPDGFTMMWLPEICEDAVAFNPLDPGNPDFQHYTHSTAADFAANREPASASSLDL